MCSEQFNNWLISRQKVVKRKLQKNAKTEIPTGALYKHISSCVWFFVRQLECIRIELSMSVLLWLMCKNIYYDIQVWKSGNQEKNMYSTALVLLILSICVYQRCFVTFFFFMYMLTEKMRAKSEYCDMHVTFYDNVCTV
jgi:hypothetical protein